MTLERVERLEPVVEGLVQVTSEAVDIVLRWLYLQSHPAAGLMVLSNIFECIEERSGACVQA